MLATALVIVADWIASNADLFPFHQGELPHPREDNERVQRAPRILDLPRGWRPSAADFPASVGELFRSRFSLPVGASPRPMQGDVVDIASSMAEPGLLIVEAAMGEGKTEAALGAAVREDGAPHTRGDDPYPPPRSYGVPCSPHPRG